MAQMRDFKELDDEADKRAQIVRLLRSLVADPPQAILIVVQRGDGATVLAVGSVGDLLDMHAVLPDAFELATAGLADTLRGKLNG